jgi:hypothetical protein
VKKAKEDALKIIIAMVGESAEGKSGKDYKQDKDGHHECACPCCGEPCAACGEAKKGK